MKIQIHGKEYEGDYVEIIDKMKKDNLLERNISTFEYANDLEYLMFRFFDKDIHTEDQSLDEKCKDLVQELLRKGIARRIQ